MSVLPTSANSLLVRTAFNDDHAWTQLTDVVATETVDGFRAYVEVVNDSAWSDASPQTVLAAVCAAGGDAAVLFIVDQRALSEDFPILVVDVIDDSRQPFRCIAAELWSVDNNLNIANMDWEEFADASDTEGIFRGLA